MINGRERRFSSANADYPELSSSQQRRQTVKVDEFRDHRSEHGIKRPLWRSLR
jgi:hypothetical protein